MKMVLRQDVAIRRADDDESNLSQFDKDKAIHVPGLRLLMNEKRLLSDDILEEQETLLVLKARQKLISEVRAKKIFFYHC